MKKIKRASWFIQSLNLLRPIPKRGNRLTLKATRALGIDDWAVEKKAKNYSTILVDLNWGQPIDWSDSEVLRD